MLTQVVSHPSENSDDYIGVSNHSSRNKKIKLIQHSREASRMVDQKMNLMDEDDEQAEE